jgi:hypothetical protein
MSSQTAAKTAAPQHKGSPVPPAPAQKGVAKPNAAKGQASAPHQAPTAQASKASQANFQKQHAAIPPLGAHLNAAPHPGVPATHASHAPAANPNHPKPHPTAQPHAAHGGATSHGSTPAPNNQLTKPTSHPQSKQPLGHPGPSHPNISNPTKPAQPVTHPQPSSHTNTSNHPTPGGHPATSKPPGSNNARPVSHGLSHPATPGQPSHPQHTPAKPGLNKSVHVTPDHAATAAHAAHTTTPQPMNRKIGSLGRAGDVKRRDEFQNSGVGAAGHARIPSSQKSTPLHGSKPLSQTSKQHGSYPARKQDFQLSESLPAILGQLAGGQEPDGEVDLEQEADNVVNCEFFSLRLCLDSNVSSVFVRDCACLKILHLRNRGGRRLGSH